MKYYRCCFALSLISMCLCSALRTHWVSDRPKLETFDGSAQCPRCSNSSWSMSDEWREETVFCSDALERNSEAASMATSGKYGVRVYIRKRRTTFSCIVNIVLRTEWRLVFFSRVQRTLRNPSTWAETIFFLLSIMFSKGRLFFFNCESITSEEQSLSIFSSFLSFSRSRWKSNKNFKTEKERIKCCYSPISIPFLFISFILSVFFVVCCSLSIRHARARVKREQWTSAFVDVFFLSLLQIERIDVCNLEVQFPSRHAVILLVAPKWAK